jgi:hypothetical protein
MLDLHHNLKPKNLFVMKNKLFILGLILSFGIAFTSCKKNDDETTTIIANANEVVLTDNIEGEETWYADSVYVLASRITVLDGAVLTIEPGTIIKGLGGTGVSAKALLVARGGKIMAQGTAEKPIIFTSYSDKLSVQDISAGTFGSPNLDPDQVAKWGGVIILGDAPISAQNDDDIDVSEIQIEGIPTSDPNGLYGGSNDNHNAGVFTYVSIRHGGTDIGAGNEINGLTLGGVGAGTTIENIEIVANKDDGIEFFGGSVNVKNVVVWNANDDGLDTDQSWNGTCDNFIIVSPDGSAFELDGPEGNLNTDRGVHTFKNGTVYAGTRISHLVDYDGNTNAALQNVYFYGWDADYGIIEDEDADEPGNQRFRPVESYGGDGQGTQLAWEYTLAEGGKPVTNVFEDVPTALITEVAKNANTVGANTAVFAWTWASQSGALVEIGL